MRTMTAKDPVKNAARENLPASDPLSVVSICLDTDTWGVLKLFADSVPLVRLDRHLAEYRVDDHESVLDWIGSPAPDVCLLDFDHDRRSAALVAERIHAEAPETSIFAVSSQRQSDLIIQAMRSGCSEYRVEHPRWKIWNASEFELNADIATLYGEQFAETLSQPPRSAIIADGSPITVRKREIL